MQQRKMILKLLKQDWPEQKLKHVFQQLYIPSRERAEKLSLEQFVQLTEGLGKVPYPRL